MKCPVCGHTLGSTGSLADMFTSSLGKDAVYRANAARKAAGEDICEHCGFSAMRNDFVNKQDADEWMRHVVIPYRESFIEKTQDFWAIKRNYVQLGTPKAEHDFLKRFFDLVNRNEQIACPVNGDPPKIEFHPFFEFGGCFVGAYSGMASRKPSDSKTVLTIPASGIIDVLYSDPRYSGVLIDPNDNPRYIPRKMIHAYTKRKDPRLEIKDWGTGIPNYRQSDVKTKEELIDFGFQIIEQFYIEKQGYEILEHYPTPYAIPHYAMRKDGKLYFLQVGVGVHPNVPTMSDKEKQSYLAACSRFGATGMFASIQIMSADKQRAAASLALCGDGYNCLEPVVTVVK